MQATPLVEVTLEKSSKPEPKHSIRYDAVDRDAGISSVYIKREGLKTIPQRIRVLVVEA